MNQDRLMSMQTVFRFVKYEGTRAVNDLFGNFISPVSRQAVQENRILIGNGEQVGIYLIILENLLV